MQKRRAERDAFRWSARRNRVVYFTRPDSGRIRPRLARTGPHARGVSGGASTVRRHNRGRPARFANKTSAITATPYINLLPGTNPPAYPSRRTLSSCQRNRCKKAPAAQAVRRFHVFAPGISRATGAAPKPPAKARSPRQSVISAINNSPRLPLMKSRHKIQINPAPASKSHSKQFQSIDKKSILPSNRRIGHSSHQVSRPARLPSPSERLQPPQKSTFRLLFIRITQIYTNSRTITATINRK